MARWQDRQGWQNLLADLVRIPSITGSPAEEDMALYIHSLLAEVSYFQEHPSHLRTWPTGDGRHAVSAFVRSPSGRPETVILLSHFDVVPVDEFGPWQGCAFDMEQMTRVLAKEDSIPVAIWNEVTHGGWLGGRGSMDMKCGLALHLALVERATFGQFEGNVLLVTVPDEEANSAGMRAMIPVLGHLQAQLGIRYTCMLNSEPVFSSPIGKQDHVLYTGSMGKVLPGFLCCGKETHVGEPFAGMNATMLASVLTMELELNNQLSESDRGEVTPPPTILWQTDLKRQYSVKVPHRAVVFANLFLLRRTGAEVESALLSVMQRAATRVESLYRQRYSDSGMHSDWASRGFKVQVMTYRELWRYAVSQNGQAAVESAVQRCLEQTPESADARLKSALCAEALVDLCPWLGPMYVLFFAPPYYPAVCSSDHPCLENVVEDLAQYACTQHQVNLVRKHYFNGISDLSYAGLQQPIPAVKAIVDSMPTWNRDYSFPLQELAQMDIPVLNLGPLGRDAHQISERLHVESAWAVTFDLLDRAIRKLLAASAPQA